jgi:hypothetical protein
MAPNHTFPSKRSKEIARISDEIGILTREIVRAADNGEILSEEDKRRLEALKEELERLSDPAYHPKLTMNSAQADVRAI